MAGNVNERGRDDVCVNREAQRGTWRMCMGTHTQTNKYSVGSKEGQEKKS